MLVFHFPISRSCPIASRQAQWPDPWAGVTECCSLLAGHREITGGGEASIERGRSGAVLRGERVDRADNADADSGPGAREGIEPVVEVQCLRLLARIDADAVVGAQQLAGRE